MISFRSPTPAAIARFLAGQRERDFTYAAVGATEGTPPEGFVVDRTRVRLGSGAVCFESACDALCRWEHFRLGWVSSRPQDVPLRVGEAVAVIARVTGLHLWNACRIVLVIDDRDEAGVSPRRFGFAYGTLPDHAERGEERFLIEWNRVDDTVWYDILAFSQPRHPLARLAYSWTRRLQRRFARDSAAAMQTAVAQAMRKPT